jgi:hypothetical protein
MTKRPEDLRVDAESAERDENEDEEAQERTEPATPPIDEDMAGSVNAAVPEKD